MIAVAAELLPVKFRLSLVGVIFFEPLTGADFTGGAKVLAVVL